MIGFNIGKDVIYFVVTSTLGGRDSLKPFAALVFGPGGGGGGTLWWGWVVPPGSLNPEPISDQKNLIFHTRFQTRTLKSMPVFRPGL